MSGTTSPRNRLAHESSLYLRQHAGNPVDWYPWGPEAIARARELDRPIFLSIGYSSCHWCHVMEHESFEDEDTARILNDYFVPIKVDREERPDLDTIYMTAHQLLTREGGGWPLSVWLTPDLHPFYAGTYFPPDDRYGRPSFRRVLRAIAEAWQNQRAEITQQSQQVTGYLQQITRAAPSGGELSPDLLKNAVAELQQMFDPTHGGFGRMPKFPHPMELRMLLRAWKRFGDDRALHMARATLDGMARGGIYDQLGGGFHRYSTDARWLVPHFEKMLYDNALLTSAYVEAFQATGEPLYRRVVEETLGYVLRETTSPEGAFYSTQDADSEGEEGKFYVWMKTEIDSLLGPDAALFDAAYDVTDHGNWEGHTILNRVRGDEQLAQTFGIPVEEVRRKLSESISKLYGVRGKRVWPGRDEKILTAWNGLMIAGFAQAAAALDEPRYAEAASRAADYVLTKMRGPDGRLFRTGAVGQPPKLNAYLEDYAYLIDALVYLYEATFEPRWLRSALELAGVMIGQFADPAGPGFFYTGSDHEELITRTKDTHDSSTPSGNAMAATALLRLGELTGRRDLYDKGAETLKAFRDLMAESPAAAGQMLIALDFYLGPVTEFAVVGPAGDEETRKVLRAIRGKFRPDAVVAFHDPAKGPAPVEVLPLLQDRPSEGGRVTTYVCENYACRAPIVGAEAVAFR